MILKGCIFVTLIFFLKRTEGQSFDEQVKRSPCCSGNNILLEAGCLDNAMQLKEKNDTRNRTNLRSKTNLVCPNGMYLLDLLEEPDSYSFDAYGSFYLGSHQMGTKGSYCLSNQAEINDSTVLSNIDESQLKTSQVILVCFQGDPFLPPYVTGSLSIVSVLFLILTVLVYSVVPGLRDLQGKCIMCTSVSLCIGFYHLAIAQFFTFSNITICQLSGFLLYYWILGAFFWMNVVSFNVMKSVVFLTTSVSEKRTFLYYNLYGWGVPFVFLLTAVIADNVEGDHIKPGFGVKLCWFPEKQETWSYFYGPVAILISCNIILFVITSIKLWNQTNYENVTKLRSMRYRFLLYLKIFLVMGISWIFEIMSFIHDAKHIVWLIMDTFNSLQGLVFFLVLVLFRKRALKGLAAKGIRLPCAPNAHTGPDEECDEIIEEEDEPALTIIS